MNKGGGKSYHKSIVVAPLADFTPSPKTPKITARFLDRAGADTPLNFRENSDSQNDLEKFLSGGYPSRNSGIHRWGLTLSTGQPNTYFSWFSGDSQLTLVFSAWTKTFGYFPAVPVTKIMVSTPAPYETLPSQKKTRVPQRTGLENSNTRQFAILGATPGAIPGSDENPPKGIGDSLRYSAGSCGVVRKSVVCCDIFTSHRFCFAGEWEAHFY